MKTRLRSEEELKKMAKYLNETYNVRENRYVSLALPSFPLYPTMAQMLNRYFQEKKWLKNDAKEKNTEQYRKFKGEKFVDYFCL